MITVQFYIEGRKTHGVGYRVHIATLALLTGVNRLYAENVPKEAGDKKEKVVVYAGASSQKRLDDFYQMLKKKIPEKASKDISISEPTRYHSDIIIPSVERFVSFLTAGELTKGIGAIEGLGKEARAGFRVIASQLGTLDEDMKTKLPEAIARVLRDYRQ